MVSGSLATGCMFQKILTSIPSRIGFSASCTGFCPPSLSPRKPWVCMRHLSNGLGIFFCMVFASPGTRIALCQRGFSTTKPNSWSLAVPWPLRASERRWGPCSAQCCPKRDAHMLEVLGGRQDHQALWPYSCHQVGLQRQYPMS